MCLVVRQRSLPQQMRPRPCASTTATLVRSGLLEPAIMWVPRSGACRVKFHVNLPIVLKVWLLQHSHPSLGGPLQL